MSQESSPSGRSYADSGALSAGGLLLMVGMTIFWGVNFPAMKVALAEIPVWHFRVLCVGFGGLTLLLISRAGGQRLRIPRRELGPLILTASFGVTGWHLCTGYALTQMDAGPAAIIAYTMPVWAMVLSRPVLGEPITLVRVVGLVLGLAGLAVLTGSELFSVHKAPWGALLMLTAALFWASATVCVKYFRWTMRTSELTGWQLLIGGIPIFIGAPLIEPFPDLSAISTTAIIAVIYTISIPMVFCQYAYIKVVRLFPAQVAALGTLAIPVVGVFSSAALLGEPIGWAEIVALVMVVGSLSIVLVLPALKK